MDRHMCRNSRILMYLLDAKLVIIQIDLLSKLNIIQLVIIQLVIIQVYYHSFLTTICISMNRHRLLVLSVFYNFQCCNITGWWKVGIIWKNRPDRTHRNLSLTLKTHSHIFLIERPIIPSKLMQHLLWFMSK